MHLKNTTDKPGSYFIRTYGCQMNVHDSERMSGLLEALGYHPVGSTGTADLILINTCAVREKPERKLFAELGNLRKVKQGRPDLIIGVTGCMAPREVDIIRKRAPHVDILLGPRSLHRLPELLDDFLAHRKPVQALDLEDDPTLETPTCRTSVISAWVDVMFGCDYSCSYCAVPTARGGEVSRHPGSILKEIQELNRSGYREVTLLGQTVNAYGRDFHYRMPGDEGGSSKQRIDFTWLLRQIDSIAPGMRVRFTSPHPRLFSDRLIEAIADLGSVCEHVHLPLQSADDEVLTRMRRAYTYDQFARVVEKLRKAVPDISITTDLIVGFPGETEIQFRRTLDAVAEMQFDQAFMFIYSPRRHSDALLYESEAVAPVVQKRRLQELIDKANRQFQNRNAKDIGRVFEVLVDGPSPKNPYRLHGRTRTNKTVILDGIKELIGKTVNVSTQKAFLWGFEGEVV